MNATQTRVESHTAPTAQARIRARAFRSVRYHREHTDAIPRRLDALAREWDVERAFETLSTALTLAGLVLGATVHRRWFALSAIAQASTLHHALRGWSPPIPILRRAGLRTLREIEEERRALEALQARAPSIVGLA